MSDITGTIKSVGDGTMTAGDAASQFRQRQWPVRTAHQPAGWPDGDPEPEPDGGFGEVEAAYIAGIITAGQYAELAEAAAEGIESQMDTQADEAKAGGPPLSAGSFVTWKGGTGRIDMIVKTGTVPGADGDITGTADDPAVRVTVWSKSDSGWSATGKKAAMKLSAVSRTAPLRSSPGGESKDALVGVLAAHEDRVSGAGLPAHASPGARAVLAVYDRGEQSWPGETKTLLTPGDWALARVGAFLGLAAGDPLDGYVRDCDLLPEGHPDRRA